MARGRKATGVCARIVAIDVRERGQRILAGAVGQRIGGAIGQLLQREQRDPALEIVETRDMGIQAGQLDAEMPRERRAGERLEAGFVGEPRAGFDEFVYGNAGTRRDECYGN
ncbi:hypothetical protein [Burkholderia seminalis]|uniref:hypothetical protein n=1 Tax=Burkholderia seminalis TaxID=488731 RepID=UPI001CF59FBD|nr:hypothetical protein [Burkholderia seminalis]MCA8040293.1 hypothetical protein [Burkholderia seminalis]